MYRLVSFFFFAFALHLKECPLVQSCTNVIVTSGASSDGSLFLAYNADDASLMGMLYHYPAKVHNQTAGTTTMRKIYNWDGGGYLGEIVEANITYNVVGNCNEHGLCIGETTWDDQGWSQVLQDGAILDYGSLIYVTLQRAKTSREAIRIMSELVDEYGYASSGESFSIVDRIASEAWIMEMIGRGKTKKGAVFVARRIPDGMITAHANLARITTFPRNDPDNCIYSRDVVDLARELDLYHGSDEDFSFSDTYNRVTAESARYGDARVWAIFSELSSDETFQKAYLDYAMGRNLTKRMPLWILPKAKVALNKVRELMANHYEGTPLDSRKYAASGIFEAPYKPRPSPWIYEGQKYVNERTISVEKTSWNFIAQIRPHMPIALSTILWFAVDDSGTAPRIPVFSSSIRLSAAYYGKGPQDGVWQPVMKLDMTKAFWVQNMVSNFVYYRYKDAYPVLKKELDIIQLNFNIQLQNADKEALRLYENNAVQEALEKVTEFGVHAGDKMHSRWLEFYGELFVRFRDYVTMDLDEADLNCGCVEKHVGYDEHWKERIVSESGDHFKIGTSEGQTTYVAEIEKESKMETERKLLQSVA